MKRPLFHFIGGMIFPIAYYFIDREILLRIMAAALVLVLLFELVRAKYPLFNNWTWQNFRGFFKENEKKTVTGMPYFISGILVTVLFFDKPIAITALCFLTFGDVTAAIIGKKFGRYKLFPPRSMEGSAAFFIIAILVGFILKQYFFPADLTVIAILASAFIAAVVETLPIALDDNLTIPIIAGAALHLLR
ncbi:MAG: SEC59/DGK1/VTE5 family protein [bacterium]|nr:SEC59/DGK1/VTE5 family protein [bacterium]MDD5755658.1 SEC59/DGK1/VTE5 family protein [bacterium]